MYREICVAILPINNLKETVTNWAQIAHGLAESKRKRKRYIYS